MLDTVSQLFEWIGQYGVDRVFLVWFFVLYIRSQKRVSRLQDARLEDNKRALEALIEAKHALTEMAENGDDLNDAMQKHFADDHEQFGKIRGKLNLLLEKVS